MQRNTFPIKMTIIVCICIIGGITMCVYMHVEVRGHCGVTSLSLPGNGFEGWNLSHCVSALYLLSHLTKKQLQKKVCLIFMCMDDCSRGCVCERVNATA